MCFVYFETVDRKDMEATLAFADDATFTVQSAHIVFDGKAAGENHANAGRTHPEGTLQGGQER